MDNRLGVRAPLEFEARDVEEVQVDAEGRQASRPTFGVRPVACTVAVTLAVVGAALMVVLSRASGGLPFLGPTSSEVVRASQITPGDVHDIYRDHEGEIDRANQTWNDHGRDPCVLVRYGCLEMDNQTYCEMAGDYCTWLEAPTMPGQQGPAKATCIKSQGSGNDVCAALEKDACTNDQSKRYGCVWQDIDTDIIARGGYCMTKEDADESCAVNNAQLPCDTRSDCRWEPMPAQTQRRLQGFPGGLPGLPGTGKCKKKHAETKDGCCAELGPDEGTCGKLQNVCTWQTDADHGHSKCESSGLGGSINDDRKREQEEICVNQATQPQCDDFDYMCQWRAGATAEEGSCESKARPPPS